jgi:hypothetical protein
LQKKRGRRKRVMAAVAKDLDSLFTRLIAEKENIPPEKVTVDYIHEQRKRRFYRKIKYKEGTEYSGYNTIGLSFLSGDEFDEMDKKINRFLEEI